MEFAKTLKDLRRLNKYTQQKLAWMLKVHQSNISDWENEISRPEYEHLVALADIFDVTLDELLGRNNK